MKKLLVCLAAAALSVAYAAQSYKVTLFQESLVNGTTLKPGDYKLELTGDKVRIFAGKQEASASVRTETADSKFGSTSVRYANGDGKYRLTEIRLGGTKMKLVFEN